MIIVVSRVAECAIASVAGRCKAAGNDRLGRQDKKPHIAAWTVGCFACAFWSFPHIAGHEREARLLELSSNFSADRTSRARTQ
ncbi:hypothetical protein [Mesorhizobium sp. L-8-3]|uniref:hypothetical protein n=1 Tax=Mesorhizobium sp. L-8-3 TaxID=2744522 RepID=UPI001927415A|nr:hypothetical protein [Mesorhizobium sp. L-8-3]